MSLRRPESKRLEGWLALPELADGGRADELAPEPVVARDGGEASQRIMNFTEILLEKGLLVAEQINEALRLQNSEGLRLDRAIIQLGFLDEKQLLEVMAEQLRLPLVNLDDITIDPQTLRALPAKIVYRKRLIAISRTNGTLNVATSDAFDLYAFDDIRLLTGLNIQPVLAPREDIEKIIKTHHALRGAECDRRPGHQSADGGGSGGISSPGREPDPG